MPRRQCQIQVLGESIAAWLSASFLDLYSFSNNVLRSVFARFAFAEFSDCGWTKSEVPVFVFRAVQLPEKDFGNFGNVCFQCLAPVPDSSGHREWEHLN